MECLFICGYHEVAYAKSVELQARASCKEDLAEIKKRYMILYSYTEIMTRYLWAFKP